MSSQRRGRGSSAGSVAPLYARLPHGPHRLDHTQVVHHQRARIHGAMVEAVAANGYAGTSVRKVVGLAGVSRRSFYEQFANKHECFLATYDLIAARGVGRIRRGYRASEGAPEERLRTGFEQLAEGIDANWKGARLVIVEAQTVGPAGLARLRRTTATCEQMLSVSFAGASGQSRVAMPVVRGIVGGVHWMLSRCLREGDAGQLPGLTEDMLGWALLFRTAAAEAALAPTLAPAGNGEARRGAPAGTSACAADDRSRLLHHVLRLALLEGYESMSALGIAESANVSVDGFFELFAGKDECFLAALDTLRDELLAVAADPGLRRAEGWPRVVRRVMARLMRYLAERPLYARTIAAGAFAAGPQAAERDRRLMRDLTTLLVAGAPAPARSAIAVDGIAGAIGHTIRCQVSSGQIGLLAAVSDHLSFFVLAPFIGAEAAAAVVAEDRLLALGAAALGEVGEDHADEH
jgi:AcrR family transcriptional regulator